MATLTITEIAQIGQVGALMVPAPSMPPSAEQAVAIGVAPANSAPFAFNTEFIQLNCDTACCLGFGRDAAVGIHRMGQNETRIYHVQPGTVLSVIAST